MIDDHWRLIEATYKTTQYLAQSGDLRAKLNAVLQLVGQTMEVNWASIILLNPKNQTIQEVFHCGEPSPTFQMPPLAELSPSQEADDLINPADNIYLTPASKRYQRFYPEAEEPPALFAGLSEPLHFSNQIAGFINLARRVEAEPLCVQDDLFLRAVASQISLILEHHHLDAQERLQRHEAETLREIAQVLNSSLDLQTVLESILDQVDRVIGYDSASIMLISEQKIKIVAHRKFKTELRNITLGEVADYPHIQMAIETRQPVIIPDTASSSSWVDIPEGRFIRSWLGVPLIGGNEVIGILNLDKTEPGFYTSQAASMAKIFANHAAIAIENARFYTSTRRQMEQLDALRATIADISAELELPKLLAAILKRAVNLLDATGGDLGLCDSAQETIEIVVSENMGRDYHGTRMVIGEGAMGLALLERQPVIIDDYSAWNNASPTYRQGSWNAVIAVPFLIGNRALGAIGIIDDHPQRRFTEADGHLLNLFAQHAAIAVENARLYQSAREMVDRWMILHKISQQIVSAGMDDESIYTAIHRAAEQLMPAEAFVISHYDDSDQTILNVYQKDRDSKPSFDWLTAEQGLSGKVMKAGRAVFIPDLNSDPDQGDYVHFGRVEQVRSVLAVPMRLRGKVMGMISVQSYQPNDYSNEDQILLEMLAAYAAIALDNSRLFAKLQQLATTDSLTNLFNRRHLFEIGRQEFLRAKRFKRPLSVIMMDIDHFKEVNDSYGHATGDQVLILLAKLLRLEVREVDMVGRYGGEEFIALLPETDRTSAYEIAERLRQVINQAFSAAQADAPKITVSLGVSDNSFGATNFTSLVNQADIAMYAAKAQGRNRAEIYTINMASPKE